MERWHYPTKAGWRDVLGVAAVAGAIFLLFGAAAAVAGLLLPYL